MDVVILVYDFFSIFASELISNFENIYSWDNPFILVPLFFIAIISANNIIISLKLQLLSVQQTFPSPKLQYHLKHTIKIFAILASTPPNAAGIFKNKTKTHSKKIIRGSDNMRKWEYTVFSFVGTFLLCVWVWTLFWGPAYTPFLGGGGA